MGQKAMSLLLLAQLVAPPLQQGPVRLPEARPALQRSAPKQGSEQDTPVEQKPAAPGAGEGVPDPVRPAVQSEQKLSPDTSTPPPRVEGLTVYRADDVKAILGGCGAGEASQQRLSACAATLTARLTADGYVNSRVFVRDSSDPGFLEVVEGRLVELRVDGNDPVLNRRVLRLLKPLQNSVLHLPEVETNLRLLRRVPGVKSAKGRLGRLGSDPSQATLTVSLQAGAPAWQGDISLRNDGTNGSGEARAVASILKPGAITAGDSLLLYGELNANDSPELGSIITSASYTFPLSDSLNFSAAFGYSNRTLIELPDPADGLNTQQYQGLGQLEWVFKESLTQRWSAFVGFSGNSSTTLLDGDSLPAGTPDIIKNPITGFLRYGLNGSGITNTLNWAGNVYMLSGISGVTPSKQRDEFAAVGITPSQSTAVGGLFSAGWGFAPSWQLNARAGGQWAFNPLTPSMQFSIGSDVGIRGLPGQLISGDSGWLGVLETSWTFWQNKHNALQLLPFIGAGGVRTELPGIDFSDMVGSTGILLRWLAGENWAVELGYAHTFEDDNNSGVWSEDWLLGKGLYAKVNFRF